MNRGLVRAVMAIGRAALHAQLRADVAAAREPVSFDEENYEPVPRDQQQLPPHRVREEEPRDLPWHLRN